MISSCSVPGDITGPWTHDDEKSSSSFADGAGHKKDPLSSSSFSVSSSNNLDSLSQKMQALQDSLRAERARQDSLNNLSAIDTLPTWEVPFFRTARLPDNTPVGQQPDPVLASMGSLQLNQMLSPSDWNTLFPYRAGVHPLCNQNTEDLYTREAFLQAAEDFPAFAAEGPDEVRLRELAAFLANIAHETTGGSGSYAPGSERYYWGLCWTHELAYDDDSRAYRDEDHPIWPPAPEKSYHGRGPIQLTWNYNYGMAGDELHIDLLQTPELLTSDGVTAFRTALWFWMKQQYPKPSAHDAIIETWSPSEADKDNNRWPGFGITINIINGGGECGTGSENHSGPADRMGYFNRFAEYLQVEQGRNIDCYEQHDFTFQ